jgi:hypothetical protein
MTNQLSSSPFFVLFEDIVKTIITASIGDLSEQANMSLGNVYYGKSRRMIRDTATR